MNTCKNCSYWGIAYLKALNQVWSGVEYRPCRAVMGTPIPDGEHEDDFKEFENDVTRHSVYTEWNSDAAGGYSEFMTGPDFGCVNFEQCNSGEHK